MAYLYTTAVAQSKAHQTRIAKQNAAIGSLSAERRAALRSTLKGNRSTTIPATRALVVVDHPDQPVNMLPSGDALLLPALSESGEAVAARVRVRAAYEAEQLALYDAGKLVIGCDPAPKTIHYRGHRGSSRISGGIIPYYSSYESACLWGWG